MKGPLRLLSTSNAPSRVPCGESSGTHRIDSAFWLPVLPGDLGGSSWHPTLPMPVLVNLLTLSNTDRTAVRFRFTPLLLGSWQIDDVYVDPFMRH